MSKEKPTDDPRQRTDWGSHKQTDKPWKGNPEKEHRPGSSKPDLEKWHETNTHEPGAVRWMESLRMLEEKLKRLSRS